MLFELKIVIKIGVVIIRWYLLRGGFELTVCHILDRGLAILFLISKLS
jgi:hypothetical protein